MHDEICQIFRQQEASKKMNSITKFKSRNWLTFLVSVIAISLVAVLGVLIWNSQAAAPDEPLPAEAFVQLDPSAGEPGTIVTIDGHGWQPGEMVLVHLVEVENGSTDGVVYGSAVADSNGQVTASFRYPQAGQTGSHRLGTGCRFGEYNASGLPGDPANSRTEHTYTRTYGYSSARYTHSGPRHAGTCPAYTHAHTRGALACPAYTDGTGSHTYSGSDHRVARRVLQQRQPEWLSAGAQRQQDRL
jgi:hypothetical protein